MIRCRVARGYADAGLERALALDERFLLEEHVAACLPCAEHQRRVRGLQELLEGPGDPPVTAPDVEAAVRSVRAALDRGEGRAWRPRRSLRPLVAAGLAAVAAAALLCFTIWRPSGPAPSVPAVAAPEPAWTASSVEVAVRSALGASFGDVEADAVEASGAEPDTDARTTFLERTRELARAGWSVRRFVEDLLDSPDPAVALGAARCLGALGDPSSVPALERALMRSDRSDGVLDALGALGEPAVTALERALAERALAPGVLRQLCRIGGERAAETLERAARTARDGSSPSRAALLDALTSTGPAAVASLLRLASEHERRRERDESTAILARLPLVEGAGTELVACLQRERLPVELGYRALFFLRPVEALPWLEQRCAEHRERALALETLASFPGVGPLEVALRLERGGRVPREEVRALLRGLLERDAERAEDLTLALVARGEVAPAQAWLALLIESEHPGAARALVPLVFSEALANDDRQWAALAVGELGAAEDAERLLAGLGAHEATDRRRTAACLLSVHALLGSAGVERLLAPCSPDDVQRVLVALESGERPGEAVLVHRVARALDGALAELAGASGKTKDIL